MDVAQEQSASWSIWRKIIFRFLFIYLTFQMSPWMWFNTSAIAKYYSQFWFWIVTLANTNFYHIRHVLVYPNGSGDTSISWAGLCFFLSVASAGCIVWSVIDYKRANYNTLNYWLCLFTRYYLVMITMIYGIIKLYALQMPSPTLHDLATPLGDYSPMRFSWQFIGYSTPYQVFSGAMEVTVGLLLLYRRTITLGLILGAAVFANVMMLNLCYDIPVKLYSTLLLFLCLFLLANEGKRIISFLILNKPVARSSTYDFNYTNKYLRIGRIALKVVFIFFAIGVAAYKDYGYYKDVHQPKNSSVIKNGFYDVTSYAVNNKPAITLPADTIAWQDVIFENGLGSIKTADTIFSRRYNRAYFEYFVDSLNHNIDFKRKNDNGASNSLFTMHYQLPDTNTIVLWGKKGADSLKVALKRSKHHFQLAERQFHWITEHAK